MSCSEESTPPHRLPLEAARSLDAGFEVGSASSLEVKSEPKIPLNPVPVTVPWSGHRENRSIHESTCLPPRAGPETPTVTRLDQLRARLSSVATAERLGGEEGGGEGGEGVGIKVRVVRRRYEVEEEG